jgi:hypothetical protein
MIRGGSRANGKISKPRIASYRIVALNKTFSDIPFPFLSLRLFFPISPVSQLFTRLFRESRGSRGRFDVAEPSITSSIRPFTLAHPREYDS